MFLTNSGGKENIPDLHDPLSPSWLYIPNGKILKHWKKTMVEEAQEHKIFNTLVIFLLFYPLYRSYGLVSWWI